MLVETVRDQSYEGTCLHAWDAIVARSGTKNEVEQGPNASCGPGNGTGEDTQEIPFHGRE